jgi:hypothetical protein
MTESQATSFLQKTCVFWSSRKQRNVFLRIYYDMREQDGCQIFRIGQVEEIG